MAPKHRISVLFQLIRSQEIGGGPLEIAIVKEQSSALFEGCRKFRIEPDRLVVIRNSVVVVARGMVRHAAVVEGLGEFRIDPDRLAVIREGAFEVAFGTVRGAAVVEVRREARTKTNNLIEVSDGATSL
jgi:hypothetical protein